MESKIQKQLIDYFSFFDEFHSAVRSNLRDCQNYAAIINKLIKRCKNIKEAEVAVSPLANFEDLQSKLCASLHNLITNAVYEIRSRQSTLDNLFEQLTIRNRGLRESCRQAELDENSILVKGSPTQPTLKQLLEYADDTITFGSQACAQVETALNILFHTQLNTDSFGEHFWYPIHWFRRMTDVITYTSFLSENQI